MGLCGDARELLDQLAAQFRRNLLDGLDLASLENLLDSPSRALREAQKVVHLLGRRGGVAVAVLPALTGLVRRALLVVRLGGLLVVLWCRLLIALLLRRLLDWLLGSLIIAPLFAAIAGTVTYFIAHRLQRNLNVS